MNRGAGQVDIAPAQVEQLAAAGTGVGGQMVEGKQAMPLRLGKKDTKLLRRPDLYGFTNGLAGPFGALDRARR